jgi:hypothetical protein
MEWLALKHALLSHLPVGTGLLLPFALLAAQRPGRGIRAWWTVSRYLGWVGLLGTLAAVVSGFAFGRHLGFIADQPSLKHLFSGQGADPVLLRHALLGAASCLAGGGALWAMTRPRKDHESLGFLALVLGWFWAALLLLTGESGYRLAHGSTPRIVPERQAPTPVVVPAPKAVVEPEAPQPVRMLDYASLEPTQPEPVKSLAHGGRWIRVWTSPEAAQAYRAGEPLPLGALVVLSTVEDRWGRPGPDPGPLYALEMKPTGPSLSFYWGHVPAEHQREFENGSRAYWRGDDPHLEGCRTCHATGMAEVGQRSRWRAKRVPPEG